MSDGKLEGKFLLAGGVAELVVAALHFLMPLSLDKSAGIAGVPMEYRSFLDLATFSVGICMIALGALSIYYSQRLSQADRVWWLFSLSQGLLWVGRAVLELILPVRIPLFSFSSPTRVILPAILVVAMLFLVPVLVPYKGVPE